MFFFSASFRHKHSHIIKLNPSNSVQGNWSVYIQLDLFCLFRMRTLWYVPWVARSRVSSVSASCDTSPSGKQQIYPAGSCVDSWLGLENALERDRLHCHVAKLSLATWLRGKSRALTGRNKRFVLTKSIRNVKRSAEAPFCSSSSKSNESSGVFQSHLWLHFPCTEKKKKDPVYSKCTNNGFS